VCWTTCWPSSHISLQICTSLPYSGLTLHAPPLILTSCRSVFTRRRRVLLPSRSSSSCNSHPPYVGSQDALSTLSMTSPVPSFHATLTFTYTQQVVRRQDVMAPHIRSPAQRSSKAVHPHRRCQRATVVATASTSLLLPRHTVLLSFLPWLGGWGVRVRRSPAMPWVRVTWLGSGGRLPITVSGVGKEEGAVK
jgi:hypothetical protein